jgi:hypothetical protein
MTAAVLVTTAEALMTVTHARRDCPMPNDCTDVVSSVPLLLTFLLTRQLCCGLFFACEINVRREIVVRNQAPNSLASC